MPVLSRETKGVIPIVATPFGEDGALALDDIARLVSYYRSCGVDGLTILGVMGEATKLSFSETMAAIRAFVAEAGDLPVLVGISGPSLAGSAELALDALDAGAFGVMLQPMPGLVGDDAVIDFFQRFIERTGARVPVCVQDYPQANGVPFGLEAWRRISRLESVFMLKHEPPAGLRKLSAIRDAEKAGTARRVAVLTSSNALHLPQELDRGADGAMVGVAVSDVIVAICAAHRAGARQAAFDLYDAALPLIRHETQGAFGLAIRKEILRRRGALTTGALRYPATVLDATDLAELDSLIARMAQRLDALGYAFALDRTLRHRDAARPMADASLSGGTT